MSDHFAARIAAELRADRAESEVSRLTQDNQHLERSAVSAWEHYSQEHLIRGDAEAKVERLEAENLRLTQALQQSQKERDSWHDEALTKWNTKCPACHEYHARLTRQSEGLARLIPILDRLENYYAFECEGGPLKNCVEWQQVKRELTATVFPSPAPAIRHVHYSCGCEAAGDNIAGSCPLHYSTVVSPPQD